jgi:hypothetical protein
MDLDLTPDLQLNLRQKLVFEYGAPEEVSEFPFVEGVLAEREGIRVKGVHELPIGVSEPADGWWMKVQARIGLAGYLVHFGWDEKVRTIGFAM